jgi:hypothetical protein
MKVTDSTQRRRERRGKRREYQPRVERFSRQDGPNSRGHASKLSISSLRLSLRSQRLCVENGSPYLRNLCH